MIEATKSTTQSYGVAMSVWQVKMENSSKNNIREGLCGRMMRCGELCSKSFGPSPPICHSTHAKPSCSPDCPDTCTFSKSRLVRATQSTISGSLGYAGECDDIFGPAEAVRVAKRMLQSYIATLCGVAFGHAVGRDSISNASGSSPHMPGERMPSHSDHGCSHPFLQTRLWRCTCIS